MDLNQDPDNRLGQTLGDALMQPHPGYYRELEPLLPRLKAIAHITGGGIPGNLPRVLPEPVSVELDWGAWPVPPIFALLQDLGGIAFDEMARVFNLGLGLIFLSEPSLDARELCPNAVEVGRVIPRQTQRVILKH
jgi:phosphoribosylformylglycinamidine cyclo-ligase